MIDVKGKYNIALNDIGFVIQGVPQEVGYVSEPAPLFNLRYAQGDRTYDDFSKWWYWAQTDWFQGFKDDVAWADDGKFYYSVNIDPWSEVGAIKLARKSALHNTFTESLYCGCSGQLAGSMRKFVGTNDSSAGRPVVYMYDGSNWTNISGTAIGTQQNVIAQVMCRNGYLWVATVGNGTTHKLMVYDNSTWYDQSGYIDTVLLSGGVQGGSCRAMCVIGNYIYVSGDNTWNNRCGIAKASKDLPTAGGDWTSVVRKDVYATIPDMCEFGGNLYYFLANYPTMELRKFNIASSVDSLIYKFNNANYSNWGSGGKLLIPFHGNLLVTVPNYEIWQVTPDDVVSRIYRRDDNKTNFWIDGFAYLYYGGVVCNNKVWWGNLVYDGEHFYSWIRETGDTASYSTVPWFVDEYDTIFMNNSSDDKKLYSVNPISGGDYKGTADKNFLVFNNFDKVSGLDKIAYAVTLIFKKFSSGQAISIEYLTGELTSSSVWTLLGTASYSLDGSSVTDKTLYFPNNTTFKKLWLRVKLEGGGSDTPVLYDVITAYLPTPFVDKQWRFNVDCGDDLTLLNGSKETRNGREIKARLEQAWLLNQMIDFQDADYAASTLNGSLSNSATTVTVVDASDFPEVGRVRIDDEIIYYTGKTQTTLTGLLRGRKGTKAVSHLTAAVIHNGYKVKVDSITSRIPILNKEKQLEYVVTVALREIM